MSEKEPPPWVEISKSRLQFEYDNLRVVKASLEAQVNSIDQRMVEIRALMDVGNHTKSDPGELGYGKTETSLDASPPKFSPRGVIRNFRRMI